MTPNLTPRGATRALLHALGMSALIAVITLITVMPFLPGRYDEFAVPISFASYYMGHAALLLAPIGAIWLASTLLWSRAAANQHIFAISALILGSIVWAVAALGAAASGSLLLGFAGVVLGLFALRRALRGLKSLRASASAAATDAAPFSRSPIPFYLLIVPIAAVLALQTVVGPATESSRARAMENAAPLIARIEEYRATRGSYPPSLLAVWGDYLPEVIGIERYYYEPSGEAYNLVFEQLSFELGAREFVAYNPLDQQEVTSHTLDLLEHSGEDLELRRGYYDVRDTSHPHWKYFLFD